MKRDKSKKRKILKKNSISRDTLQLTYKQLVQRFPLQLFWTLLDTVIRIENARFSGVLRSGDYSCISGNKVNLFEEACFTCSNMFVCSWLIWYDITSLSLIIKIWFFRIFRVDRVSNVYLFSKFLIIFKFQYSVISTFLFSDFYLIFLSIFSFLIKYWEY